MVLEQSRVKEGISGMALLSGAASSSKPADSTQVAAPATVYSSSPAPMPTPTTTTPTSIDTSTAVPTITPTPTTPTTTTPSTTATITSAPRITPQPTESKYNKDNLDVEYHDDPQKMGENSLYNTKMGTQKVYDVNGNLIDVVSNAVQGNIVYYQPGSYKYGAASYVPYYEDSVFLSRSINAVVNTPAYVSTNKSGGFCNKYKIDPLKLEQQCNAINDETCAATTCCVLLGGQKCVSGNESGPTMKDNYSDFMIANKDFYYYQGKCYGNCPNTAQIATPYLPEKTPYMNA
jgi:hypothetical protein